MTRALRFLLALWTCVVCSPAFATGNATLRVIPYVLALTQCPQGIHAGDGCPNLTAPAPGLFQQATAFAPGGYFNTTAATTGNYSSVRPPWNVSCVDYGCGNYTPAATTCTDTTWQGPTHCLLDPLLHPPAGCTVLNGTSPSNSNQLICGGSNSAFTGTIQHYNFGTVNGHTCTALRINNNSGTSSPIAALLLDDISFFNDSGLCTNATGSTDPTFLLMVTVPAGGVTISNSILDGNSDVWDSKWGGNNSGAGGPCDGATVACNPWFAIVDDNNFVTYQYTVVQHFAATFTTPANHLSTSGAVFQYSMLNTWCVRTPNCHAEFYDGQGNGGQASQLTFDHSIITAEGSSTGNAQFGPAPIFPCANANCSYGQINFTNNTIILPYVGGMTAQTSTFSGCIGAAPTGGTSTSPVCAGGTGNTLYVTAATVPLGHGVNINCPSGGFGTYHRIPGPYPSGPPAVIDEWGLDQQNGALFPLFTTSGTCTNATAIADVANAGVMQISHALGPLGSGSFTNNYMDVSSMGNGTTPVVWQIAGESFAPTFTGTITTSLGVSTVTLTGSPTTITPSAAGEFITWTGQADACSASVLACPRTVLGGTASSFALTTVVPNIGPITMTAQYPSWCTVAPTFSGNIDMLGIATNLNGWSTNSSIGC